MTAMVVGVSSTRRRADHILDAVRQELEMRKSSLNADNSIRSVSIVVKMMQGSDRPRAVLLTVETERTLNSD